MKIVYDDLFEFSEIAIRCNDTARKGKCSYCPFFDRCFDRCKIDEPENRHIQCGELDHPTEKAACKEERFVQFFGDNHGCERTVRDINGYAKDNNLSIINIAPFYTWGVFVLFEKGGE